MHICLNCNNGSASMENYITHLRKHQSESTAKFQCLYDTMTSNTSKINTVAKIWDQSRILKKSFIFKGDIDDLIKKANAAGIPGTVLVLESDGTEIADNDIVEFFCQNKEPFQLLTENSVWTPPTTESDSTILNFSTINSTPLSTNANNVISWIDTAVNASDNLSENTSTSTISRASTLSAPPPSFILDTPDFINLKKAEKLFANYKLPTDKMPVIILELLNEGKSLSTHYSDFVHCIVNDMRKISVYIPQSILKKIGNQILNLYPKSVGVVDSEGKLLCTESASIATKLINHNNYLNKLTKSASPLSSLNQEKHKIKISDGVPNFFAKENTEPCSKEDYERKRKYLKENFSMEITNEEFKKEIEQAFLETFIAQRQFLLNNPPIVQVQQYWPHLFSVKFLIIHFLNLMDISANTFSEKWSVAKAKIINYGSTKKQFINITKEGDDNIKALEIITTHFKEDLKMMFKIYSEETTQNEIDVPAATPFFGIIEGVDKRIFYFFIENNVIDVECMNYQNALELLIASYFVFNIEYPMEISLTLEVLQKICYNIDTKFSRSHKTKQRLNNKSKVSNFLKNIL